MSGFVDSRQVSALLEEERRRRAGAAPRMQCKVCWYVYDQARGCPETQTPPGTPFNELPTWWRCPGCDTPADQFLPLEGDAPDTEG